MTSRDPEFNPIYVLFSGQIFCLQTIPTDLSCCAPIKNLCNSRKSAQASCTKKYAQKLFLF